MADKKHIKILKNGVEKWNEWRNENPKIKPDLTGADLSFQILVGANLRRADLTEADLTDSILYQADLCETVLNGAKLVGTNLCQTRLCDAYLRGADLHRANLDRADLTGADLSEANLERTILVGATVAKATFTRCRVYGASAWDLDLKKVKDQSNLRITRDDDPARITVDNLEVAQFIYLLLHNEKIRDILDTIGQKGVLILGRFTGKREAVLRAIRNRLSRLGFVPMMFHFQRPTQRDFTETIFTLAGLSRFIIADITNPRSSPLELQATMPNYMIPFVPIIHEDEEPFAMFRDLRQKYGNWVLDVLQYDSVANLLEVMEEAVIKPALEMADQLLIKKAQAIRKRHVRDYAS
jgi:Pentapeptide repeats (8 copies)